MRYTVQLTVAAAVAGALLLACGEGTAPSSQQAQVLAAEQEQLGAMVDSDFGAAGATATDAAPTGAGPATDLAAGTADTAPTFWGRLRVVPGGPRPTYHRDVTIQGDTARVEHDITFDGLLLVDTSADGVFNPTAKPLADRMIQQAVLVRDDSRSHGWRVLKMTDNGDGTYERSWIARRTGLDRFLVDALDSATLLEGTADNYRANEVGIPYRIE